MNYSNWIKYIIVFLLLLVATIGVWWGFNSGRQAAQSKQVVKDVLAMQQAFEYFHADQGRYPTTGEFTDQNIMRGYLTSFPPQEFTAGGCEKNFDYYNAFANEYILRFCTSKAVQGYAAGWNEITYKR